MGKEKYFLDEKGTNHPAITRFPSPILGKPKYISDEEKIHIIAEHFKQIMITLGLDIEDESLSSTPYRVAKMYVDEVFAGLNPNNFPKISMFPDDLHHEHKPHMVFVRVSFISFCEHHFVPIEGVAYVAYLPNINLIGLSKIPRIVRFFASRPQVQERLTAQIADSISLLLNTDDVAVSICSRHFCVIARGIEDSESHAITNVLRGFFEHDDTLRMEFFEAIKHSKT